MKLAEMKADFAEGMSPTRIGIRQGGLSAAKVREILRGAGLDVANPPPRADMVAKRSRVADEMGALNALQKLEPSVYDEPSAEEALMQVQTALRGGV